MNIISILKKLKSQGSRVELDTTLYGLVSIDDVDFITSSFDGSDYIRVKCDGDRDTDINHINLYFDSEGRYVLNYEYIKDSKVAVSDNCMLFPVINGSRKTWEDLYTPNPGDYILNKNDHRMYYIYKDNSGELGLVDQVGDIHYYNSDLYDYEVIDPNEDKNGFIKEFISSITEMTDVNKILPFIIKRYSIIGWNPKFEGDQFKIMIDLIEDGEEIDVNNVVNYVIRIPIFKLNDYLFHFTYLKKFDEDEELVK